MTEIDYSCELQPRHNWQASRLPPDYCGEFSREDIDSYVDEWDAEWSAEDPLTPASKPLPAVSQALEKRFCELASKWEKETAFLSATPMMVLHDSYQSIMSMGPSVIPILLLDLQKTHRNWFWALRHLTNTDPVPDKDRGNVDKMVAAWANWGRSKGLI